MVLWSVPGSDLKKSFSQMVKSTAKHERRCAQMVKDLKRIDGRFCWYTSEPAVWWRVIGCSGPDHGGTRPI